MIDRKALMDAVLAAYDEPIPVEIKNPKAPVTTRAHMSLVSAFWAMGAQLVAAIEAQEKRLVELEQGKTKAGRKKGGAQ